MDNGTFYAPQYYSDMDGWLDCGYEQYIDIKAALAVADDFYDNTDAPKVRVVRRVQTVIRGSVQEKRVV